VKFHPHSECFTDAYSTYKKPIEVAESKKEEQQIKKKNPTRDKKTFAMSAQQRNKQKNPKSPGQIEIEKELGGHEVSSYKEWDI